MKMKTKTEKWVMKLLLREFGVFFNKFWRKFVNVKARFWRLFLAMAVSEYACIWLHLKSLFKVLMFCFSRKSLTSEALKIPSLLSTSQPHSGSQYASTRCEITARVLVLPDKMQRCKKKLFKCTLTNKLTFAVSSRTFLFVKLPS